MMSFDDGNPCTAARTAWDGDGCRCRLAQVEPPATHVKV
jgi:hypothetical protein